jgi:hypothetical protein
VLGVLRKRNGDYPILDLRRNSYNVVRRGGLEPRVRTDNTQVTENTMRQISEKRQKSISWHVYGTREHFGTVPFSGV